ncbi:MAG TPA: hypothetical protein VEZ90_15855 [Blastocatellia bacterium]|nr:hypothetical protein [Blastocatellia bacterium]
MRSQNVEALLHAYFNCPIRDYVDLARKIVKSDGLTPEDRQSIADNLLAMHAHTILRHVDLIQGEALHQ